MTELFQADLHRDHLDGGDPVAPPARTPDASAAPPALVPDRATVLRPTSSPGRSDAQPAADTVRRTLWVLLVVLASANAVVSLTTLPVVVGVVLGLGALACAWALVARHLRGRI